MHVCISSPFLRVLYVSACMRISILVFQKCSSALLIN